MINRKEVGDIEKMAFELLSKYKVSKPPISVENIAQNEGLAVVSHDLGENVSGVLVIKDNIGVIGYNYNHPKVRIRFSIAHELAHYILHGNSKGEEVFVDRDFLVKFRNNNNNYDESEMRQENEANAFAAALLMPKFLIEKEFTNNDLSRLSEPDLISFLAKKFEVSVLAMTYRLSNLNIFD